MSEQNKEKKDDVLTMAFIILGTIGYFCFKLVFKGIMQSNRWTMNAILLWLCYLLALIAVVLSPNWNIPAILSLLSLRSIADWVYAHISPGWQIGILFFTPFTLVFFVFGLFEWIKNTKYQKAIDHLGIKTSTGLTPKVMGIKEMGNNQTKILVKAIGIDVNELKSKKGSLESGFNSIVQNIRIAPYNRQLVEIMLTEKELSSLIRFEDVADLLKKPYTCLIGESFEKFVTADFQEIHHMLVAGSTGGGKSYFFKQMIVSLLKCSDHIQFYLIDLKRGVEMRSFRSLKNVKVVTENFEAILMLEAIVAEMDRRFQFLEESGHQEVDPKRDKLDRIFVGIDEASVLFIVSGDR